jgi:hypothetical protein
MGGYRVMDDGLASIVRGQLYINSNNGYNTLFMGNEASLNTLSFTDSGSGGVVSTARTPAGITASADNIWQITAMDYNPGGYQAIVAHVAPNMDMYSSTKTKVYFGDINAATALVKITDSGTGALGDLEISGGIVGVYPYLFYYGNDGTWNVGWTLPGDLTNLSGTGSGRVRVSAQKVILGLEDRSAGSQQPAVIFWALDKFIRGNFVGGTAVFQFSSIPGYDGILSSSAVVEYDGFYYWPGNGRFMVYNGQLKEVPNNDSLEYFYNNYNKEYRQKIWAMKNSKWGEIYFFYPSGNSTECDRALILNKRENIWYDTALSRSAGIYDTMFPYPIMLGTAVEPYGVGYPIWQHEYGTDKDFRGSISAIPKWIETCEYAFPGNNPNGIPEGLDTDIQFDSIELDMLQTGDMTLTMKQKEYARSDWVTKDYVFAPNQTKIDTQFQGREVRLRLESNTQGGSFTLGRTLLVINTEQGDNRP